MAYLHGTFKDFADNTIEVQIRSKNTDYVEYEISDIDKCIEDMINSYTKERLIRKKK